MIETIRQNFEGYTKKEIVKARLTRAVQGQIGHLSDKGFKHIIRASNKGLEKCPVCVADITNATAIYGPNRHRKKRVTTQQRADRVLEGRIKIL